MTTWQQFADDAPDLATAVRARLESTKHHVMATVRVDGAPRVSGTEVDWHGDDLVIGSMFEARKARDLQRDPRLAIHANPGDGSMEGGDAKLSALAVEVTDPTELAAFVDDASPPEPLHLFRLDITEVVLTSLHPDGDKLRIESWRPGEGLRRIERA
jgi:hypothetical protein